MNFLDTPTKQAVAVGGVALLGVSYWTYSKYMSEDPDNVAFKHFIEQIQLPASSRISTFSLWLAWKYNGSPPFWKHS